MNEKSGKYTKLRRMREKRHQIYHFLVCPHCNYRWRMRSPHNVYSPPARCPNCKGKIPNTEAWVHACRLADVYLLKIEKLKREIKGVSISLEELETELRGEVRLFGDLLTLVFDETRIRIGDEILTLCDEGWKALEVLCGSKDPILIAKSLVAFAKVINTRQGLKPEELLKSLRESEIEVCGEAELFGDFHILVFDDARIKVGDEILVLHDEGRKQLEAFVKSKDPTRIAQKLVAFAKAVNARTNRYESSRNPC